MFLQKLPDGIKLFIRLSPKAKREGLEGIYIDPDGNQRLKIAVPAAPVDGKANEALIKWLAKYLHVAKTSITLIAGETDRAKTLLISGKPEELAAKFERIK